MNELRIACCGGWHSHAKDFPMDRAKKYCADLPHRFVAVWDDNAARGRTWASEMGCRFEPDYDALCSDPEIDGFLITAGTTKHASLILRAAKAGKHLFTEKALTVDPTEAREIERVVKESGIHFTISDPVEKPALVCAKKMMDQGLFGEVTEIRYRTVHAFGLTDPVLMNGYYQREEAGGGALFDMGHHAVHVLYWFLGMPETAAGVFSRFSPRGKQENIDDISTAIFSFPSGAIGVAETGWLCPGGQNIFELYGTKGMFRWDCDGVRYRTEANEPWTIVPDEKLPPAPIYPLRYWMESVLKNTTNTQYTVSEAARVVEMIAAAYRTDGKLERV